MATRRDFLVGLLGAGAHLHAMSADAIAETCSDLLGVERQVLRKQDMELDIR